MELTQSQIESINSKCPYGQGIFKEPFGIPNHIKELVVYTKWDSGGMRGGSCWGGEPKPYSNSRPKDAFKVLDLVLKELKPQITFLQFREIEMLIESNEKTSYEYYGNSTDSTIEWIKLSDLCNSLETL